jgi:pyruvate/2-oxoglutarate dehydrogenase complex dihydrolipoamide acyltransferase (E2) component
MELLLPKLGFAMDEAKLDEWLVENGASVVEGQPLFTLESDKSVQEIEAPASGVLSIVAVPGETYPVGTILGEIN